MIGRSAFLKLTVSLLLVTAGCSRVRPAPPPTPAVTYATALAAAQAKADSGDYAAADRILSEFAIQHQGTREAQEVGFWRALYMVDPGNQNASISEGVRALEIYLGTAGNSWYRPQALVLRRTALSIQAIRQAQQPVRIAGRDTVFVSRDEEIAVLRDHLAKANAELERVKKRLANPGR